MLDDSAVVSSGGGCVCFCDDDDDQWRVVCLMTEEPRPPDKKALLMDVHMSTKQLMGCSEALNLLHSFNSKWRELQTWSAPASCHV